MNNWKILLLLFLLCSTATSLMAQQEQPPQGNQDQTSGGVIEIEAQILDSRVELPQVQILDKRKKSDFDEVKVEKSFVSELSGKNEELKFEPITSGKIKSIKNIDVLLSKNRF